MIQLLYHHSLLQEFQKLPPTRAIVMIYKRSSPLLLTGPAASVVLNVITGLFPPEEEPCNPFTVAIEIAEIPTPAPANCVNVIAVYLQPHQQ
jgi:hypothetical protein